MKLEIYGKRLNIKNPFQRRSGWKLAGFSAAPSERKKLEGLQ